MRQLRLSQLLVLCSSAIKGGLHGRYLRLHRRHSIFHGGRVWLNDLVEDMAAKAQQDQDLHKHWLVVVEMIAELEVLKEKRAWRVLRTIRFRNSGPEGDPDKSLAFWALSEFDPQKQVRSLALASLVEASGCQMLQGVAPPTSIERDLNKMIDALKLELGVQ